MVKSPLNYIGNKHRILGQITSLFPEEPDVFVDLFCGGCDVAANYSANTVYANDINHFVIDILKTFKEEDEGYVLDYIDATIDRWKLTKDDKQAYLAFRDHYNVSDRNPLDLYILSCYSFNHQIRFNARHEFNNPFGMNRSSFNKTMRENLVSFLPQIKNVIFSSQDFPDFDFTVLSEGDLLYADPPYLISCANYNDGKRGFKGWSETEERQLLDTLLALSERGVNFALSNVLEHKGVRNELLCQWVEDHGFNVNDIDFNYRNCNYQVKDRSSQTREVLITNYKAGKHGQ